MKYVLFSMLIALTAFAIPGSVYADSHVEKLQAQIDDLHAELNRREIQHDRFLADCRSDAKWLVDQVNACNTGNNDREIAFYQLEREVEELRSENGTNFRTISAENTLLREQAAELNEFIKHQNTLMLQIVLAFNGTGSQ